MDDNSFGNIILSPILYKDSGILLALFFRNIFFEKVIPLQDIFR